MQFINFIKERKHMSVDKQQQETLNVLKKSEIDLVIFGGGSGAKLQYEYLEEYGITADAFCESAYFYRPGKTIKGKPVYNYDDVDDIFIHYNLILAASGPSIAGVLEENCENRNEVYVIDIVKPPFTMEYEWLKENASQLGTTYGMLEDDLSRETMLSFIDSKAHCIKGDIKPLWKLYIDSQYFNALYKPEHHQTNALIDCGAWIGDTAEAYLNMVRASGYQGTVYSFEPEEDNYNKLLETANRVGDIECYRYAVGSKYEKMYFAAGQTSQSHLSNEETGTIVDVVPVDDLLGDKAISMVKMDLEGAEIPALHGMRRIITEQMPHLAICIYHKKDDLIKIPKLISEYAAENGKVKYKYYLRQHSCFGIETVFYAVPNRD